MSEVRAVLVPGVPALLPEYAGEVDPVAELRAACRSAVADLVSPRPRRVLVVATGPRAADVARGVATSSGVRVARHLLAGAGHAGEIVEGARQVRSGDALLFVASGSACRSEKAPGHLDDRGPELDAALDQTVRDGVAPPDDEPLAEELWCFDLPVFRRLHALVAGPAEVRCSCDPYGVAYWVATWRELRAESR
jgi:hypothetical protein